MQTADFISAVKQIAEEKGLDETTVLETVEAALAAAYRKEYGKPEQIVTAEIDPKSNQIKVWQVFDVFETDEEAENPENALTLEQAKKIDKKATVGERVQIPLEYHEDFGRIAAQTAKQVIVQRLREAERDTLYNEFKDKKDKIITGTVQQIESGNVIVNLGKINGIIIMSEQVPGERYYVGQRIKIYVVNVEETSKGPRILLSRAHAGLVREIFALEVPEIAAGSVEIKGVAREAGSRSKVAVYSNQDGIDPVGSAVGQRGTRVQAILAEIGEEKIDIILWDEDPVKYITNALSPAKVNNINLNAKEKKAVVEVPDDQLSLAIGKGGQNVRLASRLSGWNIDISKNDETPKVAEGKSQTETTDRAPAKKQGKPKTKKTEEKGTPTGEVAGVPTGSSDQVVGESVGKTPEPIIEEPTPAVPTANETPERT